MKITYENIIRKIENIENEYDVDSITLEDSTKIWNLLRVILAAYIIGSDYIKNERKNKIKKIIFLLKESISKNKLPKNVDICAVSDVESQKKRGKKYYDIYTDSLNEIINNYFILDWPSAKAERYPVEKNHVPLKIPLPILIRKIIPYKPSIKKIDILKKIIIDFSREYNLDEEKLEKHILESIVIFKIIKNTMKGKIKRINPKIVLVRAAYGRFQMGVVQACKELGIKTIELQHGLIYEHHYGYIKKQKSENYDCVPDFIFTWGDFFSDIIKKGYLFRKECIISVGFPYLENKSIVEYKDEDKINDFCKRFKKIVLVSGQKTEYIDNFIRKAAEKEKKIGYIYKPHPRDERDLRFEEENIKLMERNRDIYSLFKYADVNLTVMSTTMLEALFFGLPSIAIKSDDVDIKTTNFIDEETIHLVGNENRFLKTLYKIGEINGIEEKVKERAEMFFKKKASENMKKNLKIIKDI
jgi:hypothetical protein